MAKEKRNATLAWLERSNPLRGLTISQANMIFDCARNGDTQRLHWMYQEIETQNPVLSMATTRRAGAAPNFAWRVVQRAAMDGSLSAEQFAEFCSSLLLPFCKRDRTVVAELGCSLCKQVKMIFKRH